MKARIVTGGGPSAVVRFYDDASGIPLAMPRDWKAAVWRNVIQDIENGTGDTDRLREFRLAAEALAAAAT